MTSDVQPGPDILVVTWCGGQRPPHHVNNLHDDISGNAVLQSPRDRRSPLRGVHLSAGGEDVRASGPSRTTSCTSSAVRKTWHTLGWLLDRSSDGQTLFFKKGAAFVEQHFESRLLRDDLLRARLHRRATWWPAHLAELPPAPGTEDGRPRCAIPVRRTTSGLEAFFSSMRTYFAGPRESHRAPPAAQASTS